jgi:hypothetical protein
MSQQEFEREVEGASVEVPVEASEADALDQARVVLEVAEMEEPHLADDVPEADALDQARAVSYDEEDDR